MALQQIVEQTVTGLGYDLVEIERCPGGLLRITIDWPWQVPAEGVEPLEPLPEIFVTVEDCEKVTRQLQFALEVDGAEYKRLEVSSPGIDRPLRHEQDYVRFAGSVVDLTLKAPIGVAAAAGQVSALRKKFRGTLERAESGGWQIVWSDEPPSQVTESVRNACQRLYRPWVLRSMNCGMRAWRRSLISRDARQNPQRYRIEWRIGLLDGCSGPGSQDR